MTIRLTIKQMSQNKQLLFVRIPKNASTSIYKHLGDKNVIDRLSQKFEKYASRPPYIDIFDPTHAFPQEILNIIPKANEYLSFAIVRNPWDRMVSMYLFAQRKKLWTPCGFESELSFEDFCKTAQERLKSSQLDFYPNIQQTTWTNGPLKIKEILFFENLQEDFKSFLIKYGIEDVSPDLPWLNSAKRKEDYRSFFSKKARQIVEMMYDDDIKEFNYKF